MRKTFVIVLFSALISFSVQLRADTDAKRNTLVVYFSSPETDGVDASSGASRIVVNQKMYGATEHIARIIGETTGGTLFRIQPAVPYPGTHNELVEYAKREGEAKSYPAIASKIRNFADYDVVFVGYPNWWYDMPRVIYTLFREYDFTGKRVIPFCTHGGSGFSQSVQTIGRLAKGAKVTAIPAISRSNAGSARAGVIRWLQEEGYAVAKK